MGLSLGSDRVILRNKFACTFDTFSLSLKSKSKAPKLSKNWQKPRKTRSAGFSVNEKMRPLSEINEQRATIHQWCM